MEGRSNSSIEDDDEVVMPLCAWAVYRVGMTFSGLGYSWDR